MIPNHHLSDATLMSYASGNCLSHMALVISAHLDQCLFCRHKLQDMEQLGGCLLEIQEVNPLADTALHSVLDQLDGVTQQVPQPSKEIKRDKPVFPSLVPFLPDGDVLQMAWRNLVPGIKTQLLVSMTPAIGTIRLLKIAPGVALPLHDHEGDELTLVLKGSYHDEIGRFKPGDIADLEEGIAHQPISDSDEDCICLIATQGPLKFKAIVPRIMQYFIAI